MINFSNLKRREKRGVEVGHVLEDLVQDQNEGREQENVIQSGIGIEIVSATEIKIGNEEVHLALIEEGAPLTREDLALLEDQDLALEIAIIGVKKVIEDHVLQKKSENDLEVGTVIATAKGIEIVTVIVKETEKERKTETRIEIGKRKKRRKRIEIGIEIGTDQSDHLDEEDLDLGPRSNEQAGMKRGRQNQGTSSGKSRVLGRQVAEMVRQNMLKRELLKLQRKWICLLKAHLISMTGEA